MRSIVLGVASLALVGTAFGFGTIRSLGQNAEHERITRAALNFLGPKTLDELAGKNGTFGGVGAPDRPGRGLINDASAHCDGADHLAYGGYPQSRTTALWHLTACRNKIDKHMAAALAAAKLLIKPDKANTALNCPFDGSGGSAKCRVLEELGLAFHGAQDFYSHTNWNDKAAPGAVTAENPPGLGRTGRAPFMETNAGGPFPDGLISGCFEGVPEAAFCNYGIPLPYLTSHRVKHEYLNKDKGPIGASGASGPGTTDRGKHSGNFKRAVGAAIEDTAQRYAAFEKSIMSTYGDKDATRITCALRSDDAAKCGDIDEIAAIFELLGKDSLRARADLQDATLQQQKLVAEGARLDRERARLDGEEVALKSEAEAIEREQTALDRELQGLLAQGCRPNGETTDVGLAQRCNALFGAYNVKQTALNNRTLAGIQRLKQFQADRDRWQQDTVAWTTDTKQIGDMINALNLKGQAVDVRFNACKGVAANAPLAELKLKCGAVDLARVPASLPSCDTPGCQAFDTKRANSK